VAAFVVVALEIVDVEHQQRDLKAHRLGALEDGGQEVLEISAVINAGELIGNRELLEAIVTILERRELGEG